MFGGPNLLLKNLRVMRAATALFTGVEVSGNPRRQIASWAAECFRALRNPAAVKTIPSSSARDGPIYP
jgi:hypothetical protein